MGFGRPPGIGNVKGPLGQALDNALANAQINQIRGVSVAGSLGAGIPKQVTDVAASVTNASAGSTSVVKVTFRRNPADSNFSTAQVYVRNYNGNAADVAVAAGANSPVTFVLNNTGESIVITVQSVGNTGSAPISSSPTTGLRLPQSTSGGFGPTSNTGVKGSGTAGALAVWSSATSISAGNLTGDTVTSGSVSSTVQRIQSVPVSNGTPNKGDILRFNLYGDSKWDIASAVGRSVSVWNDVTSAPVTIGAGDAPVTVGTASTAGAVGTEPPGRNYFSAATASANVTAGVRQGWGANIGTTEVFTWGSTFRFSMRLKLGNTTNCRFWIGCGQGNTADFTGSSALATDTPNRIYAAFRYSSGTDTNIKACCGVSSAAQSVVDTGILPDTSASHLFEISWIAGTSFRFYLDGTLVATIASNLPVSTDRFGQFWCSDNRSTNTAVGATFYNSVLTLK